MESSLPRPATIICFCARATRTIFQLLSDFVGKSGAGGRGDLLSTARAHLASFNAEIIRYREDVGNAIGAHVNQVLVTLICDHSFQGHLAILYDDVDRRQSAKAISRGQGWIAVNGAVFGHSDLVVHG